MENFQIYYKFDTTFKIYFVDNYFHKYLKFCNKN